jgi:hypothetical protein
VKRRDFLRAALLTPWLMGCWTTPQNRRLEGSIVGASHKVGHRLRQAAGQRPGGARRKVKVLVAGGGVAGLTAAWRLRHAGVEDFLILELEKDLGGNSRSKAYPISSAPWGAHYLPVPTRESKVVGRILSEMGIYRGDTPTGRPIYDEADLCHTPQERIFVMGRWEEGLFPRSIASQDDLRQFHEFEQHIEYWRNWRDLKGRKAFALPLAFSSPAPEVLELDQISMAQYLLQKGWDSPRLRWYVEYGCRDDYGISLDNTSAWAGLHYFASRDGGGFEPRDIQFVWPQGNHRLVEHLAEPLAERHKTNTLVMHLQPASKGWEVDCWDESQQAMVGYQAEHVIVALPAFMRPYLMGTAPLQGFSYAPWTICNLLLESEPPSCQSGRVPVCWDNVLYDSPGLGYVVANHQTKSYSGGPTLWTYYRPWCEMTPEKARQSLLQADWSSICQQVFADLSRAHPDLPPLCRQLDVMQLGHAMIAPRPGFIWGESRRAAQLGAPGLYFAHSDLSGISIFEEASYQGVRAAQELLDCLGLAGEDFLV